MDYKKLVAAVLAALIAAGVIITVADNNGNGKPDQITITIGAAARPAAPPPPGSDAQTAIGNPADPVARPVTVDANHSSDGEPTVGAGSHEDLVDEFPGGVPQAQLEKGVQQDTAPGKTAPLPVGGSQNYTCRYKPVGNQSSRNGQQALLAVLHYTVSQNRPGLSDVNAIWGLFNTRSFAASSTFIIDFEGNCLRLMNEKAKPWTQGNFNGRSISVEIVATGGETRQQWLDAPLIKNGILSSLWRDVMRRNGIPLRRVDPSGCTVQQAGWTDHDALECGNDHHDVRPAFPYDVFQKQLAGSTRTAVDKVTCRKLNWWRAHGRPKGAAEVNAVRRRKALAARNVICSARGPLPG